MKKSADTLKLAKMIVEPVFDAVAGSITSDDLSIFQYLMDLLCNKFFVFSMASMQFCNAILM